MDVGYIEFIFSLVGRMEIVYPCADTPADWLKSKPLLPIELSNVFVASRDQCGGLKAKEYKVFESPAAALAFAETCKGKSMYEGIVHAHEPCMMFFDLDREDNKYTNEDVLHQFTSALRWYMNDVLHISFVLTLGVNSHACESTREGKTSIHVVTTVYMQSVNLHSALAQQLSTSIRLSNSYPALIKQSGDCIVDKSVYCNFRLFRMMYMDKHGLGIPLQPIAPSSTVIGDHLVRFYPGWTKEPSCKITVLPGMAIPRHLKSKTTSRRMFENSQDPQALAQASEMFSANKALLSVLKVSSINIQYIREQEGRTFYVINHNTGATCPYANRIHGSNHLYLHMTGSAVRLRCHAEDCRFCESFAVDHDGRDMSKIYDSVNNESLHPQRDNITWGERYNEPSMRPLPLCPITCVRAGMGTGKTKAIKELLSTHNDILPKALIITFSRSLAKKMHEEFKPLGFTSYMDTTNEIRDEKIVVCLDSLYRVDTRNFDIIILDEAVSVFLHFNSPLMQKSGENSTLLELLLFQATHIYMVDACVDATFVKNIADYFSAQRGQSVHWIFNEYVRNKDPTIPGVKRAAYMTVKNQTGVASEHSLIFNAAKKVVSLLEAGKRVVVCSSTKTFTTALSELVASKSPSTRVIMYNSSTTDHALDNVNELWTTCDLLIYSPSISAGVSFEVHHFDCLVGFLVNSDMAPTVDLSLQQLFRVRNLSEGNMYLYIQERSVKSLPHTDEEVGNQLENTVSLASKHCTSAKLWFSAQLRIKDGDLKYDRDRLSYQIIKGIIVMQNRSAMFYSDILGTTLKEDYGIEIYNGEDDETQDADFLSLLQDSMTVDDIPPFDSVPIITRREYDTIAPTTDIEKAAMRLFEYKNLKWHVEEVDDDFYKAIMKKDANEVFHRDRRFCKLDNSLADNKGIFAYQMEKILKTHDPAFDSNLEVYKKKTKDHHSMIIEGQLLLLSLLSKEDMKLLKSMQPVTVDEGSIETAMNMHTLRMDPREKKCFEKLFGLKKDFTVSTRFKKLLLKAFGLDVSRASTNPNRPNYSRLVISNTLAEFKDKYKVPLVM